MTTITEITELKAEMDAKFDRAYDQVAELSTELNGFREDMNGFRENVNERLDGMDAKLDLLLKAHGIEPSAEVG